MYSKFIEKSRSLPTKQVTREEFVVLLVATGMPQEDAERQAKFCAALGSEVEIGGYMVSIAKGPVTQ